MAVLRGAVEIEVGDERRVRLFNERAARLDKRRHIERGQAEVRPPKADLRAVRVGGFGGIQHLPHPLTRPPNERNLQIERPCELEIEAAPVQTREIVVSVQRRGGLRDDLLIGVRGSLVRLRYVEVEGMLKIVQFRLSLTSTAFIVVASTPRGQDDFCACAAI